MREEISFNEDENGVNRREIVTPNWYEALF
jgi:hypothetical protein